MSSGWYFLGSEQLCIDCEHTVCALSRFLLLILPSVYNVLFVSFDLVFNSVYVRDGYVPMNAVAHKGQGFGSSWS